MVELTLTYTQWAKTYGTKLFASFHVKRANRDLE